MSSKMFKQDSLKREERTVKYKRGQLGPELDLATRVAKLYLSGKLLPDQNTRRHPRYTFDRSLRKLSKTFENYDLEGLDHILFFEMLLLKLGKFTDLPMPEHTHCLIDPLVQLMYLNGLNNFLIDVSPLSTRPDYCGSFLTGQKGNLLIATYVGESLNYFAQDSRNSVLTYNGKAVTVGQESVAVETFFDGECNSVGLGGNGSVYELLGDKVIINPCENHDCTFRVESDAVYKGRMARYEYQGFFSRGNKIEVSDDKGGWNRIVPLGNGNWKEVPE